MNKLFYEDWYWKDGYWYWCIPKVHPATEVIEKGYFCPVCGDKRPGNSTPCQSLVNNLFCDRGISY